MFSPATVRKRNFTPCFFRSSSMVTGSRKLRPNRSSFQTHELSPCPSFFKQRRTAGRFVVAHPVGCVRVVLCNVTAYVVEVRVGFGVKRISAHAERLRCASVFAFRRAKASSPSMGFTLPFFRSS
jgi:hypothetical protein